MRGLNYLAAAYTAIWIALFLYLLSIGRRARRLERELAELRKTERSEA
jgi:CcmD family protein